VFIVIRWAIDRALAGLNSLLVLPTGAGKSLCFFLPAVILGGGAAAARTQSSGLTIVVSPLISLMQDQLRKLPVYLPGACFTAGMSAVEGSALTCALIAGLVRILFVSPERLCTQSFRNLIRTMKRKRKEAYEQLRLSGRPVEGVDYYERPVALLCVDEAHCLSQWSFNFRPSFLRIKREISFIAPRAVIALTATASPGVQKDIAHHLDIPLDTGLYTCPPARYNLSLNVVVSEDSRLKNEVRMTCAIILTL
jgi:ATP-dependent DNA helicase Q4